MTSQWPPNREADLAVWSLNFKTRITATPSAFGLTAPQSVSYGALHDLFISALNVANSEATRSPMNVNLKNVAKRNLVANIRLLGGIVQRFPATTNAIRLDLGLPQRDFEPTPVPAPANAPQVVVKGTKGRTASIRLVDIENPTRRAKPLGVSGAAVFSHVGEEPPVNISDWVFQGNTGRTIFDVQFPDSVESGATVWLTAFWFNPAKQSGPACNPVSANLPGGNVSQAA